MPKRTTPANGPTVWALAVVSSEGQVETLPYQRQWAQDCAKQHGWRLGHVVEGVSSGKAGPRRVVRGMLAELRALEPEGRPKFVLMIRADRIGRGDMVESQIILRDLRELGVGVYTRDQGEVKLDSAMQQAISAVTLAVAAHENEIRSEKMLVVRRRKAAAGERMGTIPYGLKRGKDGKDAPDGERAKIVEKAFAMRLAGNGYQAIGKWLAVAAPPQVYRNGNVRAPRWAMDRVRDMMRQRAYVGTIIDEATFARAQRVAATLTNTRKGPARRHQWPLAGTMKCHCGRGLIGSTSGVEPWRIRYYVCRARWNHDGNLRLYRAEKLEAQFMDLLGRLRASPSLVERHSRKASAPVAPKILENTIRELKAKLATVAKKRDGAWELHAAGSVRAEDVQERLDGLAAQRDELQWRISSAQEQLSVSRAAASRKSDVEALLRRAVLIFNKANIDEQNQIARAVSLELGGLYVDEHLKLQIGTPAE
jgi:DNA invertase Pin-like site-specific DNA recombinase